MIGRLDVIANRRAHLVAALALAAGCVAIVVARAIEVDAVSGRVGSMCAWLASASAAIVVGVLTKKREHFTLRAVVACGAAGVFVGWVAHSCIAMERPLMQLSFAGEACGPSETAFFGGIVGAAFGAGVGLLAGATRTLTEKSPHVSCACTWTLTAATAIAARSWLALAAAAIGIVIQLASSRRVRVVLPVRPYR